MLDLSVIMDPNKFHDDSDIREEFLDGEEEQQNVATVKDNFTKGVMTKLLSRNYENLPWIIEKIKSALHRLQIRNERYFFTFLTNKIILYRFI
ncbi:unnamed protein product [Onchocerca flexuosa]|uniref:DUF4806 domain-containing protein n=1 Tax=Onchocerca flexuosa TaxID=387005 RepID=A0A183I0P4_9BILA|nr:unnamed protein product [Onchocerca flexuosa]